MEILLPLYALNSFSISCPVYNQPSAVLTDGGMGFRWSTILNWDTAIRPYVSQRRSGSSAAAKKPCVRTSLCCHAHRPWCHHRNVVFPCSPLSHVCTHRQGPRLGYACAGTCVHWGSVCGVCLSVYVRKEGEILLFVQIHKYVGLQKGRGTEVDLWGEKALLFS
jgi:hypothetical protein